MSGIKPYNQLSANLGQTVSIGNTKTITSSDADVGDPWIGAWENTRSLGYVRQLVTLVCSDASIGGTFTFEYSENGSTATISEARVISDFATIRDFDLLNAGEFFRVKFEPDEALASNTVTLTTIYRRQFDGPFVRLAGQEIEEANAAMGQQFSYLKAFIAATGKSTNIRANKDGVLLIGDFRTEVGKGNISNHTLMPVFGYNPSVSASSTEDVIYTGTINFLQAASAVRIKSGGNAADDSSGAGAQTVLVEGLSSTFAEVSETITTNGADASTATTQTFIRLNKATVVNTGTYGAAGSSTAGANTGDITIETTGGTTLLTIQAGVGVSQSSLYTIPAAKTGYMSRFSSTVDANKAVDVGLWKRINADDVSTPFGAKSIMRRFPGLAGDASRTFDAPITIPAKTDVWCTATTGSGAAGVVAVSYDIVLVDD